MTNIFPTALVILSDGAVIEGHGFGAETSNVGEICFNTAMSGYQETMTDPSFASQIITFTAPHIGNVGTNAQDIETMNPAALGMVVRERPTEPSNFRSEQSLDQWLKDHDLPGIYGVDTRALTRRIRDNGAPNGVLAVNYKGEFDLEALKKQAAEWAGLEGMDLAKVVSCTQRYEWDEKLHPLLEETSLRRRPQSIANENAEVNIDSGLRRSDEAEDYHIVAMDFGAKQNILRSLAQTGAKVTVVPAQTPAEEVLAMLH